MPDTVLANLGQGAAELPADGIRLDLVQLDRDLTPRGGESLDRSLGMLVTTVKQLSAGE